MDAGAFNTLNDCGERYVEVSGSRTFSDTVRGGLVFRSDGPFAFQHATQSVIDKRNKCFFQISPPANPTSDYAIVKFVKDIADNSAAYIKFANTLDSTSTTTGSIVIDGGLGVAKCISALNMSCTSAPSAATDVVRKTELDAISGTTGMARFAAIGIGQAPIANVPISINADGMFDPQIQITDAASDVYNFRLRTAGDTGSELSLGCTYGPSTTSGLFAIANGIVLTTNDTTDVSWSGGGPPLGTVVEPYPTRIKGGLFVEKQIACTSRLTAANVTCASMPSADTDVMRKVDIVNCSATLSGTWTVIWESTNPVQTIKVVRYGSLVCMSATLWVMGFTNASGSSPYSLTLASDYRPVNTQTFQIAGYTLVTEPSDTILERSLALNVTDAGAISLHPCYNQTFISGEFIYISAFSVVWTIV